MVKTDGEQTKEELQEELKKIKEELELQKWGAEKIMLSLTTLQKEIIQKNEYLQNRIKEIEKMNKHMVGRELKMIELKKELSLEKSKNLQNQKAIDK